MLSFSSVEQRKIYVDNQLNYNPSLIYDLSFVLNYLVDIPYSLEQYPTELTSNDLFIYEYFSTKKSTIKEYSFISENLLNNPLFLNKAIVHNPDIYLLVNPQLHTKLLLDRLEHFHPDTILKYVSPELLNNYEYCSSKIIHHSENYQFAPDFIKKDTFLLNSLSSIHPFNINLFKYFPKSVLQDKTYMNKILKNSPRSFQYFPKSLKNDPDFCHPIICKDPLYFKYVSSELKNNVQWVHDLISNTELRFTDLILTELPPAYFTKDFCKQHEITISNYFTSFSLEQRKIKALYMAGFQDVSSSYLKNHIAFLPNNELKKTVREFVKLNKKTIHNNYDEFIVSLINLMDKFDLHESLEKELVVSENLSPRLKL